MKKSIIIIASALLLIASTSCTYRTCPTYSQAEPEQQQEELTKQEEQSRW